MSAGGGIQAPLVAAALHGSESGSCKSSAGVLGAATELAAL